MAGEIELMDIEKVRDLHKITEVQIHPEFKRDYNYDIAMIRVIFDLTYDIHILLLLFYLFF